MMYWLRIGRHRVMYINIIGIVAIMSCGIAMAKAQNEHADNNNHQKALLYLEHMDDLYRGTSSTGRMIMQVKTEHWQRKLVMDMASLGEDYTLMRIISPRKEKGTATLKINNDIYNYLPKTDRTIKISSGMMGGSWMGSHFTNDDIVAESRLSRDFKITISFEGVREGTNVIEITLIPKEDTAVVWGKIIAVYRLKDKMPVKSQYFDEDMNMVRIMTFHDYKKMEGRLIPSRMRLTPIDKPNEYTELIYESIDFDAGLKPDYFSLRDLRRRR